MKGWITWDKCVLICCQLPWNMYHIITFTSRLASIVFKDNWCVLFYLPTYLFVTHTTSSQCQDFLSKKLLVPILLKPLAVLCTSTKLYHALDNTLPPFPLKSVTVLCFLWQPNPVNCICHSYNFMFS